MNPFAPFLALLLLAVSLHCPTANAQQPKPASYAAQWKIINRLVWDKNLPKTAIPQIEQLYRQACSEQNVVESVRALIYLQDLYERQHLDNDSSRILFLQERLSKAFNIPQKSLLQLMLARAVHQHGRYHPTQPPLQEPGMPEAAPSAFNPHIQIADSLYREALLPAHILQQTKLDKYEDILEYGGRRPATLYDLLAHEILDDYKNYFFEDDDDAQPLSLQLTHTAAMAGSSEFVQHTFAVPDSTSPVWKSLFLYQQLEAFHLQDTTPAQLITAQLCRLQFVLSKSFIAYKDSLYLQALSRVQQQFPAEAATAQAWYLQAQWYCDKAADYKPLTDTTHRYYYVKAKAIIEQQLQRKLPESEGKANMQHLLTDIHSTELSTQTAEINSANLPILLQAQYRNVPVLYGRIYRYPALENNESEYYSNNTKVAKKILRQQPLRKYRQVLPQTADHQLHTTEIKLDGLPAGNYLLAASSDSTFNTGKSILLFQQLYISSLAYVQHASNLFILNRETGFPVPQAKVYIITQTGKGKNIRHVKRAYSVTTNGQVNGMPVFNEDDDGDITSIYACAKGDTLPIVYDKAPTLVSQSVTSGNNRAAIKEVALYTDRSVYRAGQNIHFKGIVTTHTAEYKNYSTYTGKDSVQVYLLNATKFCIDSATLSLNSFGSFSGSFSIPTQVMPGNFLLEAHMRSSQGSGNTYVHVEAYKRPGFAITLNSINKAYRLGDTLAITGNAKTFSGMPISNAAVQFSITREADQRIAAPSREVEEDDDFRTFHSRKTIVTTGKLTTAADGSFQIRFVALPDSSITQGASLSYNFTLNIKITDITGETHETQTTIPAGRHSARVFLPLPPSISSQAFHTIPVALENHSGQTLSGQVTVTLYPVEAPARPLRNRLWNAPDQFTMPYQQFIQHFPYDEYSNEADVKNRQLLAPVFSTLLTTSADTLSQLALPAFLPAGWYAAEARYIDSFGDTLHGRAYIEVNNYQQGRPAAPAFSLHYASAIRLFPGDTASLYAGNSAGPFFLITHERHGPHYDTTYRFYSVTDTLKHILLPITEKDCGGMGMALSYVSHNRFYYHQTDINVLYPKKNLEVHYATYRNKTQPGSSEQWTIQVQHSNGLPAKAELATTLYDASLDVYATHQWLSPVYQPQYSYSLYWNAPQLNQLASSTGIITNSDLTACFSPDEFDKLSTHIEQFRYMYANGIVRIGYMLQEGSPALRLAASSQVEITKFTPAKIVRDEDVSPPATNRKPRPQETSREKAEEVRKNFMETAFFLPQLQPDSSGNYTIRFTMPDALTQWKWISLAHTQNGAFGIAEAIITTQKKLMALLYAPRFVTEGDTVALAASIRNADTAAITGTVTLQLYNALTGQPADSLLHNYNNSKPFYSRPDSAAEVRFSIAIPKSCPFPVRWRIVAKSALYSDGEENSFAVLPRRTLITESMPMQVKGNQTKTFTLQKLANNTSTTLSTEALTIEYTSNPIWKAVQALPYLAEFPYECAEQTFNRYYAHALPPWLMRQYPEIQQTVAAWAKDSSALQSPLQQNEALKQVLLQQTPWVVDAVEQNNQKLQLVSLFNAQALPARTAGIMRTLYQRQLPNGGFSWYKGGSADDYITTYILTGIGKLFQLKAVPAQDSLLLCYIAKNAVAYLDNKMEQDYKAWQLENKPALPFYFTRNEIQYLFARSFFPNLHMPQKNMLSFLLQKLKNQVSELTPYTKALAAQIFSRNGQKAYALKELLPSIMENAITDSVKGRFWYNPFTCFWHASPIEHQSAIMYAISELNAEDTSASLTQAYTEMRNWLLRQQQTQHWGTTIATADACFALLAGRDKKLLQPTEVTLQTGNIPVTPNQPVEAGTGYFQQRINGDKVTAKHATITVTTQNAPATNSISYGAAHWQYFEEQDKITASANSPFTITKEWFMEKTTASGVQLEKITPAQTVKVGDKLTVRLTLHTRRALEYVHVKDNRAATMEPAHMLSGYQQLQSLEYYKAIEDAGTSFFISYLPQGTFTLSYPVYVTHSGTFSGGIATAQCMYAPEFNGHSAGMQLTVQ